MRLGSGKARAGMVARAIRVAAVNRTVGTTRNGVSGTTASSSRALEDVLPPLLLPLPLPLLLPLLLPLPLVAAPFMGMVRLVRVALAAKAAPGLPRVEVGEDRRWNSHTILEPSYTSGVVMGSSSQPPLVVRALSKSNADRKVGSTWAVRAWCVEVRVGGGEGVEEIR